MKEAKIPRKQSTKGSFRSRNLVAISELETAQTRNWSVNAGKNTASETLSFLKF